MAISWGGGSSRQRGLLEPRRQKGGDGARELERRLGRATKRLAHDRGASTGRAVARRDERASWACSAFHGRPSAMRVAARRRWTSRPASAAVRPPRRGPAGRDPRACKARARSTGAILSRSTAAGKAAPDARNEPLPPAVALLALLLALLLAASPLASERLRPRAAPRSIDPPPTAGAGPA